MEEELEENEEREGSRGNNITAKNFRGDQKTEGIVFVPSTPNGGLAKGLQASEDRFAKVNNIPRISYVEKGYQMCQESG